MERRMSPFVTGKLGRNLDADNDHSAPGYYNDPSNIGRGVEDAFAKFGKEMPQTIRDNIDSARAGEPPRGTAMPKG